MALYLVRWPDLSCTLVTARDEDHLGYLLDEVGNPEGCRWTEYDGPVFIDFHLPVRITIDWPEQAGRPLSPEAVQIEDLDRLAQREELQAEVRITGIYHQRAPRLALPQALRVVHPRVLAS